MKKILQINITCGRGSTGNLSQALYKASQAEGYAARFAYSAYTPALEEAFPIETKWQNYLRRGLNRFFGRKQRHSTPGTKRLIRYIKKEKPDLIHLHNVQQNSVNYHKFFAFLKDNEIPVVYTLHDCWVFTGGCFHFTKAGCQGYQTGCKNCPLPEHPDDITCSAESAYGEKKKYVGGNHRLYPICVSNWLRDCARASYMGQLKHIPQTIYNGIDTEQFAPKKSNIREDLHIAEDAFVVLGVASFWTEEKGLSVFRKLRAGLPKDTVIVLVGQGAEQVQNQGIICIPKTENQEQLAQLYSAADVYINASIEETFGMTTAEALACGTPAVVFHSTACPEVVDEHTGIVVENVAQMLDAVQRIKEQGKQTYALHCVERANTLFNECRMVQTYLELYRRILNEK